MFERNYKWYVCRSNVRRYLEDQTTDDLDKYIEEIDRRWTYFEWKRVPERLLYTKRFDRRPKINSKSKGVFLLSLLFFLLVFRRMKIQHQQNRVLWQQDEISLFHRPKRSMKVRIHIWHCCYNVVERLNNLEIHHKSLNSPIDRRHKEPFRTRDAKKFVFLQKFQFSLTKTKTYAS